jgi:hypothetical protein
MRLRLLQEAALRLSSSASPLEQEWIATYGEPASPWPGEISPMPPSAKTVRIFVLRTLEQRHSLLFTNVIYESCHYVMLRTGNVFHD